MVRKPAGKGARKGHSKVFVLDTNVLLHDPYSLFRFENHDIYIPFVTLEELDGKKAGTQDVNRNARQATRLLSEIVSQEDGSMVDGYPLDSFNGGHAKGRLFVQRESLPFLANEHFGKNDNLYLAVLDHLTKQHPGREVIMVTKDLNLSIKARAMNFKSEDYKHDHVVEDADVLYRGIVEMADDPFDGVETLRSWKEGGKAYYEIPAGERVANEFLHTPDGTLYQVLSVEDGRATLTSVTDYRKPKHAVLGISARNEEQMAAFELLLDPEVDFVALLGPAGTGKTLLALAAGLHLVGKHEVDDIIFTRATIPLGEDIGFLPGGEEEKMGPWMGALTDNLEVICEASDSGAVEQQKLREFAKLHMSIKAITFMRGRTFHRKYLVLDEAQNLTPKQMKALITRAGEGTKIVCMGNLAQIDSPYLSETSSGLAYAVSRFKGWRHFGALVLQKGERSRLANEGNDRL